MSGRIPTTRHHLLYLMYPSQFLAVFLQKTICFILLYRASEQTRFIFVPIVSIVVEMVHGGWSFCIGHFAEWRFAQTPCWGQLSKVFREIVLEVKVILEVEVMGLGNYG